ncbi:hypothetical protein FACS1894159_02620 [Bacteroidia bacterium]|nr:hypothetical protein FACS1894159_02620 [Bacteroidia bacterium]
MKDSVDSHSGKYASNTLSVDEAREFFEGFVTEFTVAHSDDIRTRGGEMPVVTPLWNRGCSFYVDGVPMVEVPFNLPVMGIQIVKDPSADNSATRLRNTAYRMLARKTAEGGIDYFVVSYTADIKYLRRHGNPDKITFADMKEFSGMVIYRDLSGKLLGGRILRNGADVGMIKTSDMELEPNLPGMPATRSGGYWEIECESYYFEDVNCSQWSISFGEGFEVEGEECYYFYNMEYLCTYNWIEDEIEEEEYQEEEEEGDGPVGPDYGRLQEAIDKISADCVGAQLMTYFNSTNNSIQYIIVDPDNPNPPQGNGYFDGNANTIVVYDGPSEDYTLLEEVFHVYQQGHYNSSEVNKEIEVKMAKIDFANRNGDKLENRYGDSWKEFMRFARTPSADTWQHAMTSLSMAGYNKTILDNASYASYASFGTPNLNALLAGCL